MTSQLLPDDILTLTLEDYLTEGTGYTGGERLQTIKSVSLSSRTLALACRRLIFENTKAAVGGCPPQASNSSVKTPAEGLQELFQINPSYFGFVNSLRIESTLLCRLEEGIAGSEVGTNSDIKNRSLGQREADGSNTVSIHYTSTTTEEAAICWLLSQHFPNLKSFHFVVRPANTGDQSTIRKAAFARTLPSLVLTVDAGLPEAIIRFLSAGNESLEHLTLSSNLPPPILRRFNGSKLLKSLSLTKYSEAKPVNKSQTEIPFFLGLDDNTGLPPSPDIRSVEVENLSCDMSGGNLLHWLYGPHSSVDVRSLKTLHLNPANEGRPFPFGLCSTSLTDLDIVYSNRTTPPASLSSLVALRRVTIRVEAEWSLDQVSFSLNTLQSQTVECLEVGLRLTHVMDFKVIQLLTSLDRRLFTRKHEWENLKTLRVVGYMSDGEWEKVEAKNGFGGFKDCLRSLFNPLLKGHRSIQSVLHVDVVKDSVYPRSR